MERLAAKMGGTVKFPYNDSECLDADFFKVRFSIFGMANSINSSSDSGGSFDQRERSSTSASLLRRGGHHGWKHHQGTTIALMILRMDLLPSFIQSNF